MTTEAYELEPCPFCGAKASMFSVGQPDGTRTWGVDCENYSCEVCCCSMQYRTREEAAMAWNRRPAASRQVTGK